MTELGSEIRLECNNVWTNTCIEQPSCEGVEQGFQSFTSSERSRNLLNFVDLDPSLLPHIYAARNLENRLIANVLIRNNKVGVTFQIG